MWWSSPDEQAWNSQQLLKLDRAKGINAPKRWQDVFASLIARWPVDGIDDQHLCRTTARFQAEA
jgi:hypothetical protein